MMLMVVGPKYFNKESLCSYNRAKCSRHSSLNLFNSFNARVSSF